MLLALGVAWVVMGIGGLGLAALGTERLEAVLPPLAIDTEALRGAIVAVSAGVLGIGVGHLAILLGLRMHRPLAWTVGILGGALMSATLIALAATSGTTAVADPDRALAFTAGALAAAGVAGAYALVTAQLIAERRAGSGV